MNVELVANIIEEGINVLQEKSEDEQCDCDCDEIEQIRSYKDACMLTDNEGLVLTMRDGSEYQITIVKRN